MPKGNCILFISTVGAFYSKLFNLKEHPNYDDLYEPWTANKEKYYDHKKELKYEENSNYKLLCDSGLGFVTIIENPKIENVDNKELKQIYKSSIIELEDLKIK